jgi:hypothetical protein
MSTHVFYCVRASEAAPPADPLSPSAVPVAREIPAAELARAIRPDGTLAFLFDGLRVPIPLPKLAAPMLNLIDGQRSVADIFAQMRQRGFSETDIARNWGETWRIFSALNRILLAPPA